MSNFNTTKLTITFKTKSGEEHTFSTTNQDLVKYYGAFRMDSVRPTVVHLFRNNEGEFQLSYPKYSQSRSIRVELLADPVLEEVVDDMADDSWLV